MRWNRTENEIWVGFGPVGNTEKELGADYEQLLRVVLSCFQGQKINLNFFVFNIVASALKSSLNEGEKTQKKLQGLVINFK